MSDKTDTDESANSDINTMQKNPSEIPKIMGFIIGFGGIYFLIISLFSLLTIMVIQGTSDVSGSMSADDRNAITLTIISILISLGAIYIGIKLIKHLDIGRKLFNIYAVAVTFVYSLIYLYKKNIIEKSFANIPPELAASVKGGELSGLLVLFILPAILVIVALLLNLKSVKNSLIR